MQREQGHGIPSTKSRLDQTQKHRHTDKTAKQRNPEIPIKLDNQSIILSRHEWLPPCENAAWREAVYSVCKTK